MRRTMKMAGMAAALAALIVVATARDASACPNCKEAVSASSGEVSSMSSGYNWSVLFMLAVPFSIFGTGAFMIRRATRRGSLPEW